MNILRRVSDALFQPPADLYVWLLFRHEGVRS